MLTSGLTNAPISKGLLIYTIAASVALAILDIKHLATLQITPHLWPYGQYWRLAAWQVAGFGNSTEALFAAMLAYHLRVVERAWGTRKMATFLLTTLPYTTLLPPLLLLIVRPLTLAKLNALPSGPTATLFAVLAQYHASIPQTVRYCLSTTTAATTAPNHSTPASAAAPTDPPPTNKANLAITLSDKSTTYLVAAQLAASQFPNLLLPAVVGWGVGLAWRTEALPLFFVPGGYRWRVPGWVVGQADRNSSRVGGGGAGGREATAGSGGERYDELRRRLEGEVVAASGSSGAGGAGAAAGSGVEGAAQRLRRGVGA
ncbi:hypothetical protein BO86DRAFT_445642 [Aspergillus japonicus CBS 114.51]|uniref:UBA domain-containing protein Ucp14 n=2 Tax=Aspergillus TaxID=5052 RepID=A0A2V5HFA1_ASPV1|nr:hypothetical protein BO86DRAFT_445642 [Aspergillus japonicus CBS 114.51]PYI22421.1 hypothetical protein BO99DRAFT_399880 [Aspergillus violaceofuscus CBS 115571]RAH85795.1 hypothetical protein BO86DRAFT_445642 [Aspergillus japonicus CBS 114.51]